MFTALRLRSAATLAGLALAGLVAGCAESPAPPAPRAAQAPSVSLSPRIVEEAGAYRAYMTRATAISPAFADGADVARSLSTATAYEPQQLVRGAIAYGAVVALQDPGFVGGVRSLAADPTQRLSVAYAILRNPAYVLGVSGAAEAADAVVAAVGGEGRALFDQGKLVKQAAYDIQRQSWSKAEVADRAGRLQQAKTMSAAPLVGDLAETARLQQAILQGAQSTAVLATPIAMAQVSAAEKPMVVRALAVAALAVLGQAGDAQFDQVSGIMVEPNAGACLRMSKLNLFQCLAVSKPHYEDVFCLGEHILKDTGRCLVKSSGAAMPAEPPPKVLDVSYRDQAKGKAAAKKR